MPSKSPILKKKHILIFVIVAVIAGLIGGSPYLYKLFLGDVSFDATGIAQIFDRDDEVGDPYLYAFPIIEHNPRYFLPLVANNYAYGIQPGVPAYLPNFAHPEMGCNWAGVAGQVFDRNDNPMLGYTVVISGTLNGNPVSLVGITGNAQVYGPGGYEIQLSSSPVASSGTISAYLLDGSLKQVAESVNLATYADCQANLLLLNFTLAY